MPQSRTLARVLLMLLLSFAACQAVHAAVGVTGASFSPTVGTAFTGEVAAFTDSLPTPQQLSATIFWGDGTSSTGTISGTTVLGTHTYTTPAPASSPLSMTVMVSDSQTSPATTGTSAPVSIVVADAALTGTYNVSEHGGAVFPSGTTVAAFTYGASAISGQFLASINWGDGTAADTSTTITGTGPYTVTNNLTHTYALDGVYSITTTITDNISGGSSVNNVVTYTAGILTTTTLATSANPSAFGSAINFTATVTAADSSTPSGTVNFYDGGSIQLGSAGLSTNIAVFSTNALSAGLHSITAAYQGDTTHDPSNPSAAISQQITTSNAALILISTSQNPVLAGQLVTFTCIVTSGNSTTPNGTVSFLDTDTLLSSVVVTSTSAGSAQATFATAGLATGAHLIRATYGGDTNATPLQPTATFDDVYQVVVGAAVPASSSSSNSGCGHGIGGVFLGLSLLLGLRALATRDRPWNRRGPMA